MHFEKPQKGNPNSLTVNQHIFPAASIARFAGSDGLVEVHLVQQNIRFRAKPTDQVFCASRVWDQRAENGYMKVIEDTFQVLADSVVSGTTTTIVASKQHVVTEMFALWNIREHRTANPIDDMLLNEVIKVISQTTKDDREKLEMKHIGTIRNDKTIPGRQICGINMQANLREVCKQMGGASWGILRAKEGQFVVPDNCGQELSLPVSPDICFYSGSADKELGSSEVAQINSLAIAGSREFYFARELASQFGDYF